MSKAQAVAWSSIGFGLLFCVFGLHALITGRAAVDVDVEGLSVRIGGALLAVFSVALVVSGFRKK